MSEDWNTKYGRRRVRRDPPTLDEAIFAAIGITDDQEAQAEIAASLMGLPIESVQAPLWMVQRKTFAPKPNEVTVVAGSWLLVMVPLPLTVDGWVVLLVSFSKTRSGGLFSSSSTLTGASL